MAEAGGWHLGEDQKKDEKALGMKKTNMRQEKRSGQKPSHGGQRFAPPGYKLKSPGEPLKRHHSPALVLEIWTALLWE